MAHRQLVRGIEPLTGLQYSLFDRAAELAGIAAAADRPVVDRIDLSSLEASMPEQTGKSMLQLVVGMID